MLISTNGWVSTNWLGQWRFQHGIVQHQYAWLRSSPLWLLPAELFEGHWEPKPQTFVLKPKTSKCTNHYVVLKYIASKPSGLLAKLFVVHNAVLNVVHNNELWSFFCHNFRLIRRIQQNKIYKKFKIACLTIRQLNHYTRMFSVLVWGYSWILFMHGWFCPIRLINLIGRKSLHFEKKN